MNLLLQDPFTVLKEYPEKLSHTLENPLHTRCVKFSTFGDYLAVGSLDGGMIIYDMDTFQPICVLGNESGAHVKCVQSINWSTCGRYLVTSSKDWSVKIWDLSSPGELFKEYLFESSIWNCEWFDSENFTCIVTTYEEPCAFLIDFSNTIPKKYPIIDKALHSNEDDMEIDEKTDSFSKRGYTVTFSIHPKLKDIIITATSKGWIIIHRILTPEKITEIYAMKIGNTNVKQMIISEEGDKLAINCADRTIRQYNLIYEGSLEKPLTLDLIHKYQDVINRLQWNSIVFSNKSAEYLVASTHGSSAHELYIWETNSGSLVRVLEGSDEELMDIDWNFYNMCIASNGLESGDVYVWSIIVPPKWSALAPDFEEVEENVKYREKEDEFDEIEQQQESKDIEEFDIDLTTKEQFDVRGNDLTKPRFIIPLDYQRRLLLQSKIKFFPT